MLGWRREGWNRNRFIPDFGTRQARDRQLLGPLLRRSYLYCDFDEFAWRAPEPAPAAYRRNASARKS